MARRAVRAFRGGKTARSTLWIQFDWTGITQTAEGGTLIFVLNAAALALLPFTIVRSYFLLQITSDQGSIQESTFGAFGIAVVSAQAAAIGVTAIPTPVTEGGSDLFLAHRYYAHTGVGLNASAVNTASQTLVEVDSKAMRKVNEDQDIVVVAEFDSAGSGQLLAVAGRMLIKLH